MSNHHIQVKQFLAYCTYERNLSTNTLRAYKSDLIGFEQYLGSVEIYSKDSIDKKCLHDYITIITERYKARTIKRKVISLKLYFNYLLENNIICDNPLSHMELRLKKSQDLPRTISSVDLQNIFNSCYSEFHNNNTALQQKFILRDVAVLEFMFCTGARVGEISNIKYKDIDLINETVLIVGKGQKERVIHLSNRIVLEILKKYMIAFEDQILESGYWFVNRHHNRLSPESIRNIIRKYQILAKIEKTITPHMFRHTVATLLLEEGVDIRYIQQLLGHASLSTTVIYTHISSDRQRILMRDRHPRDSLKVSTIF